MESAMHLPGLLKERRRAIVGRWKEHSLRVYPERAVRFLARERDRFRNPVGHVMGESLGVLFDGLVAGVAPDAMRPALDAIVRIRAVQDLSPSAAIGFVFLLKPILEEELNGREADPEDRIDLTSLFRRIDRLALEAFDLYMECRETIFRLRVREIRGRSPAPAGCPGAGAAAGSAPAGPAAAAGDCGGGCPE